MSSARSPAVGYRLISTSNDRTFGGKETSI